MSRCSHKHNTHQADGARPGVTLPLRAFPSTAPSIILSLTLQQPVQSINDIVLSFTISFFFSLSLCVFVQLGSSNYVCMCVFCQRRHARVKRLMDKPQSKLLLRLSSPFSTFHSLLSINRFVVKKILVCFPFAFKQRFAYSSEHLDDDHSVEEKVEDLMYLAMPAVTCGNTP